MNKITIFLAISCIASVYGNGELTVLHHPASLSFRGHDHLKESVLTELYSAALGFSTDRYSNWNGVLIENPFDLAEAVVTLAIEGVPDVGRVRGHRFPLRTDEDEGSVYEALEKRVLARYPESDSHLVRVDLAEGLSQLRKTDLFRSIKHDKSKKLGVGSFKTSVDEDHEFLKELSLLNDIIAVLEAGDVEADGQPDVYWFKVSSLHPLADLYGENSTQVKEAKQLLNEAAIRLNNVFKKIYDGKVLFTVITSDAIHTRRSRSILQADDQTNFEKYNLAKNYSEDYPVIFNIILWFGVLMFFTLLAICMAFIEMDPGRDSIIYRMTSTRLKKE